MKNALLNLYDAALYDKKTHQLYATILITLWFVSLRIEYLKLTIDFGKVCLNFRWLDWHERFHCPTVFSIDIRPRVDELEKIKREFSIRRW